MNWKKSDIPLMLNGLFVGALFWKAVDLDLNKINIFYFLCFIGSYISIIVYGSMTKKENEEK
jgi:hypothetical protein